MTEIKTPTCPMCGEPPGMVANPQQAFCTNLECDTLNWDMTMTFAELRQNTVVHDLRGIFGGE